MRGYSLPVMITIAFLHNSVGRGADPPGDPTWSDLVVGDDAIELATDHPHVPKIRMLKTILLPPRNTKRSDVEGIYGKHVRIDEPNAKEPDQRHMYMPMKGMRLIVVYKKDEVVVSWFSSDVLRSARISRAVGEPRYSVLVEELSLELQLMTKLMAKLKRPSNHFPWSQSPARSAQAH